MEKLGLPDRAYRPSLPFGVDLFGLLPPPIFLDLVWQVVHHRHQEAKELNHVLRILLIRPRRSRLWVRILVCERANFVGPFLHDRQDEALGGEIVDFLFEVLTLGTMRAGDELNG